jgi:hypothetical protein
MLVAAIVVMRGLRRAGCRDSAGQILKPLVDFAAEYANADEYDDRDGGDQQAVLDYVLTVLLASETSNEFHAIPPRVM